MARGDKEKRRDRSKAVPPFFILLPDQPGNANFNALQPPRHLHRNDQEEVITHWVSGRVAWGAVDPV